MKKSLIALAVASTFAAPAFAATANVDIYGKIKMSYDYINTDAPAGANNPDENLTRVSSNASRLGFKGTEDLGGGLKGIWQWELGIRADEAGVGSSPRNRNTYLGLSGGFGTVLLGVHDTPYKMATGSLDVFGDTMGDYNAIMGSLNGSLDFDARGSNVLAYLSPNFSGFSFALARANVNENGTQGDADDDLLSVAGMYNNGPLYVALAWEKHENLGTNNPIGRDLNAYKLGVGYKFGNFKVGAGYETVDDSVNQSVNDRDAFFINGAYMMGAITLKAQYAKANDGEDPATKTGASYFAVGADYKLSKRTKAYILYAQTDNDKNANYNIGGDAGGRYSPGVDLNGDGDTLDAGERGYGPSVLSIGVEHSF